MKLPVANVSSAGDVDRLRRGRPPADQAGRCRDRRRPGDRERRRAAGVDLQLGLTANDLAALARATPPEGPVVLSARVDVVDETAAAPLRRCAFACSSPAPRTTSTAPTVVEAGDEGGLSNAVEVLIPVDPSQMFGARP